MIEIEETLIELDRWYNELPAGNERPTLLSKLAMLELCGWLEDRFDKFIETACPGVGVPIDWAQTNVIKKNYGFSYTDHFRKMMCQIVGESAVLHLEEVFEADHPGKLDQLRGSLGSLWKSRKVLAHTHISGPVKMQTLVNAPSWALNQQKVLAQTIDLYEGAIAKAFVRSIAKPITTSSSAPDTPASPASPPSS